MCIKTVLTLVGFHFLLGFSGIPVGAVAGAQRVEEREHPDIMIREGLRADRKKKTVHIQAEATGLTNDSPIEFLLVSRRSGHDYEALAVSLATPGDIQEALEFIGMQPGLGPSISDHRFWPKGERVFATVEWEEEPASPKGTAKKRSMRFAEFIQDTRTGKAIPFVGWVFTGSPWETVDGERVYAADAQEPGSIISIYNESFTVLDVPRPAHKGDVYGYLIPHPDITLQPGQRLDILFEPEYRDGRMRVRDYLWNVQAASENTNILSRLRFTFRDPASEVDHDVDMTGLLAFLGRITREGCDPYVTVAPDPSLSLGEVKTLYAFLDSIQGEQGIRLEPPLPGHLFYKSFLPNDDYRELEKRPSQPWELHLSRKEDRVHGMLRAVKTTWLDTGNDPRFDTRDYPAATPEEVKRVLGEGLNDLPVLLVFAPADMTYGELLVFTQPVHDSHPTVYIFLPLDPG